MKQFTRSSHWTSEEVQHWTVLSVMSQTSLHCGKRRCPDPFPERPWFASAAWAYVEQTTMRIAGGSLILHIPGYWAMNWQEKLTWWRAMLLG